MLNGVTHVVAWPTEQSRGLVQGHGTCMYSVPQPEAISFHGVAVAPFTGAGAASPAQPTGWPSNVRTAADAQASPNAPVTKLAVP